MKRPPVVRQHRPGAYTYEALSEGAPQMICHAIPPTRFFSQTPNDLIRHPRLNGTAVRLLQWALSLPEGSRETLQSIGEKMPEGRIALRRARQQLEAEGYVHTRRAQSPETGRWTTRVLVSNVPLR